ncbi:MAG TPA: ribbon-helix-helix protein, CopG family [Dermatophilaceae bacterium]
MEVHKPREHTASGRLVTDELIEQLADEAEAGYDPDILVRRGGRRPMGSAAARVVPVRVGPELEEALRRRAEHEHTNTSDVIRDALRAWLHSA